MFFYLYSSLVLHSFIAQNPYLTLFLCSSTHSTKMASSTILSALIISLSLMEFMPHHAIADPADGFTSLSLDRSNFVIHKPYDVSESERYSFQNGIHKLWVYSADKPFMSGSNTSPRTEVRVRVSTICIIYIRDSIQKFATIK